jgi:hypothetical protein
LIAMDLLLGQRSPARVQFTSSRVTLSLERAGLPAVATAGRAG